VAKTIVTKMKQSHEAPVEQFSSTSDLNKKNCQVNKDSRDRATNIDQANLSDDGKFNGLNQVHFFRQP